MAWAAPSKASWPTARFTDVYICAVYRNQAEYRDYLSYNSSYFPLNGMPGWMNVVVKMNPLTYAVDLFKKIILEYDKMPEVLRQAMGLNLKVGNHLITAANEVGFITLFGAVMIILAVWSFNTVEQ